MFYINVSNGLLTQEHRDKMGSAVWEFMWCIDKVTQINEKGEGLVLGGKPIKLKEIGMGHDNTTSRNLIKLEKAGYINTTRTPYGVIVRINKAKKRFGNKIQQEERITDNGESPDIVNPLPEMVNPLRKMVNVIKTVSVDNTVDKAKGSSPPRAFTPQQEVLNWSVERRGGKFANVPKQMKAFDSMKKAGISIQRAKNRWCEMERDKFWKEKGFDWQNVLNSFDKKP